MFYLFSQNNSGGFFEVNDKVCHFVIIEADDYRFANIIAEDIGIYFDGCENDTDCPCCGDRWDRVDSYDGKDQPMIYSIIPEDFSDCWTSNSDDVYCRVYYKNGEVKEFKGARSE